MRNYLAEKPREEELSFQQTCSECGEGFAFAEKKRLEDDNIILLEQCTECSYSKRINRALTIENDPITKILKGIKTWEMRDRHCRIRESIGLIEIGTGTIVGAMEIIGTRGPMGREELLENKKRHCSDPDFLLSKGWDHAWILKKPRKFVNPIPYKHPRGAQMWVKLTKKVLE